MVAADYRLKRIAMAHDPSPIRQVSSYLDFAAQRLGGSSAAGQQHRWWFVGHFDAIHETPDGLAFQLSGQGIRVAAAPTVFGKSGSKQKSPKAGPAARQFANTFTKYFPALAKKIPVFAELRNLIGLSVVAELIARKPTQLAEGRDQNATPPEQAEFWRPVHFLDTQKCPIVNYSIPKKIPSLASYRLVRGRRWLISVSGGVEISPRELTSRKFLKLAGDHRLRDARLQAEYQQSSDHWWWD